MGRVTSSHALSIDTGRLSAIRNWSPSGVIAPKFEVLDASDAYDAVDLSRPDDFTNGVVVVLLDELHVPLVAMAVDRAPSHDLTRISELIIESAIRVASPTNVCGVVFGIVKQNDSTPPDSSESSEATMGCGLGLLH